MTFPSSWRLAFALPGLLLLAPGLGQARADDFREQARPVLERFCLSCHNGKRAKGGVILEQFRDSASIRLAPDLWLRAADALAERTMPPEGKPGPEEADRQKAAQAIRSTLDQAAAEGVRDPGPGPIQRLTREQYNLTMRDLLGVDFRPADRFPADGGGGSGFDNNASTLFVPPILLEKMLGAAGESLDRADPALWCLARPDDRTSPEAAARACIEGFAPRAFRRPVAPEEVDRLMGVFARAQGRGLSYEESVKSALKAVLVSPHFLFLIEAEQPIEGAYRIGPYELASRLSYFLWSSMPDAELFAAAARGTLHEPEELTRQTLRMLADPKAEALARGFAGQWLGVNSLKHATDPDRGRFPEYDADLRDAMIEEPVATFASLLRDDRPLLDLIDCDYVVVNERLAKHYGIEGVSGPEFRKVARNHPSRGGVLGMAGVLTLTSYPQRTSPVLRGKWVLEEVLGTPPPPPPPDVRVLPPEDRPKDGQTFRQRLEQHRRDPGCASCHAKLDPLGFGLENFDPIGRWRTEVGGGPLDASGVLTSGETFTGPVELKRILKAEKRDLFTRNVVSRMLSYSLRRGLEFYDAPTVGEIAGRLAPQDFRVSALVVEIVTSYPFLNRRNAPVTATGAHP